MKAFLLTTTLILSSYAQSRPYICPHFEDERYQCVQSTLSESQLARQDLEKSAADTTLTSQDVTKKIFEELIRYEKSLSLRLHYSSIDRVANPVQRVVIIGKRLPKEKPAAPAIKDDSRFVAFVHAANSCLETDSRGVPVRQTDGCETIRANALKYTLQSYAAMVGKSLQEIVDSLNVNANSQDELIKTLSAQDQLLAEQSWGAQYQQQKIRTRVSKFESDLELQ